MVEQRGTSRTSTTNAKIPQSANAVNSKFSAPATDSEGNALSEGQRSYFAGSKVRDAQGRLKVMYRGGNGDYTVFDRRKSKPSNLYGRGFYFTDSQSHAAQYGEAKPYYLNITSPLTPDQHVITKQQMRSFLEAVAADEDYGLENYGYGATVDSVLQSIYGKGDFEMLQDVNATAVGDLVTAVELFNEVNGTDYDGIIVPTETVAFQSEQIKNTDNLNPTKDPDIRFSRAKWTPKLTKAERSLIDYAVNAYEGEDFNGTKRYVLKSKKGETVFAVYSTETNTPTLLFANSGNSAIIAKEITDDYKEYANGNRSGNSPKRGKADINQSTKRLRNISGSNAPGSALSGNSGTANSNAGILEGQLRYGANGRSGNQQNGRNSRELRALINTLTDSRSVRFSRESFPAGEQPRARDVEVPVKVNGRNVSQTVRTVEEAAATPDDLIPTIDSLVQEGVFSYDRVSNKERIAAAEESVRREGFERTLEQWSSAVSAGGVNAENTALGSRHIKHQKEFAQIAH